MNVNYVGKINNSNLISSALKLSKIEHLIGVISLIHHLRLMLCECWLITTLIRSPLKFKYANFVLGRLSFEFVVFEKF